jgi:type II secretory ATPase GspE/PulE/Tfp pilus assembly ATPase PilB-like protein
MTTGADDRGVVTIVDRLLGRAIHERASDIHIEPRTDRVRVRFRIDGILVDRPPIPESFRHSVASRLKVMASLDIAEKRLPQDGAFTVQANGREVDLRLSTFPTEHGEKVVLRVLNRDVDAVDLRRLGMEPALFERVRAYAARPHGMFLVTGPTGSGKTSTLYALLREVDSDQKNVVTLEDPIEYRFENIIQGQTHVRAGFTFATGLRAVLRQDPDVIMVGEMRDGETADIAFKAALTGHLVLSSLHTSSALETFVRLLDMGLERFVVASALHAMLGQRLVRRLCTVCMRRTLADAPTRALMGAAPDEEVAVYEPQGCPSCNHTGFLGRTGIYELVEMDEELADLLKSETTTRRALRTHLEQRQYQDLRAAGFAKVRAGHTTVSEVLRVT